MSDDQAGPIAYLEGALRWCPKHPLALIATSLTERACERCAQIARSAYLRRTPNRDAS